MPRWYSALAFLLLTVPLQAQLAPEKALATLQPGDGLQVELFAAEPMLLNPTSMDIDHLGRVWVCEAVNYRRKLFNRPILREEGDRIVILTDSNGDGKADASSVFYQGKDLIAPLGICVLKEAKGTGYKVYVCQSPDILLFEDKDGDGKADGPPKKFLTGFNGFDHDHGVHSILVGPDGKFYFTVGDAGVKDLQSSDGKGRKWTSNSSDCRAGTVWRCDLDGKNLELIAHNFRNNYECCVDSFGEVWLSDNDDDGNQQTRICFVMPGGNYGYHPRGPGQSHWHEEQPGIVHKAMRTGFGSPTGICFYEGTLLPKQYQGDLIHADAGPKEIRYFKRKPKGAGYEMEKINMLTSTDNWFRPSDVCVAPDGSVFVADWYDPGVGGHGMGDWTRGRIYRLTPKGHRGYAVPVVKLETKEGIAARLASPCLAVRQTVFANLKSPPREDAETTQRLSSDPNVPPHVRARALWQMGRAKVAGSSYWLDFHGGLGEKKPDPDNQFRAMSIRIQRDAFQVTPDKFISHANLNWTDQVYADQSPAVRREALLALRDVSPEAMRKGFYEMARRYDSQDHFYRAALNIACGSDPKRRDAILADFDKHFPEWNDKVADLVWELRPKSVLPRLQTLLTDAKVTPAQKGRIVDILAASDDPAAGTATLKLLTANVPPEVQARALENLRLFLPTKWKALARGDELKTAIDGLLKDPKTTRTSLQLIAAAGATDRVERVAEIAASGDVDLAVRSEAIRTLGRLRSARSAELLGALVIVTREPANQVDAVKALANLITGPGKDPASAGALVTLQALVSKDSSVEAPLRSAALQGLAANQAGTQWLLDAHQKGKLPQELVADAGRLLRNSPFQGERNKALLLFPAPGKLDVTKLPSIQVLANRKGDADNGKAILARSITSEAQCLKCHMVRGLGGQIGPDLSMIGKKASRENLYESLLAPTKAIADQYLSWKVDTDDGQSITGLLVGETPEAITLRDANGKDYTLPAKGTEKKKVPTSIMPDNLVNALTEDELVDVVEYLATLQTPSLTPEAWRIAGPFPGGAGNAGLDVEHGPGKAFDSSATFVTKNGKTGWRTVRTGANSYVDLAAFHGPAGNDSVSYLVQEIESPREQKVDVLLGTDDGAILSVNGKELHSEKVTRAAAPEQAKVTVTLKKGSNLLLLKIANGNNPHGFYLTLVGGEELKAR